MGILKSFSAASHGALADQWLEAFTCDALGADILALRGYKMQSDRSANRGSDNVITVGSILIVPDGACALVTEMGEIIASYDTPGEHKFTGEKSRSIFGGKVSDVFRDVGKRFTFGGDVAVTQRVYFVNTKEIPGNAVDVSGVTVRLRDSNTTLDTEMTVNATGAYSFRISDPVLFFKNICGNVTDTYARHTLTPQLHAEIRSALPQALVALCAEGVRPFELATQIERVSEAVKQALQPKWQTLRGIQIISFALDSLTVTDADKAVAQSAQRAKMLTDPTMAAATLTAAVADALPAAAQNAGGTAGAFAFFSSPSSRPKLWRCGCGCWCSGNFCENCGAPAKE